MYIHECSLRVRYAETDQMSYMYHGNYAQFLEVARAEMMRSIGMSYKDFEAHGMMLPVVELNIQYKKPAKYDDEVRIKTVLNHLPSVRVRFDYELFNQNGEHLTTAYTKLVCINIQTKKPCMVPLFFLDKLKPYFKDQTTEPLANAIAL